MSKKIAILDLNPFFGGGQKFLLTLQKNLSNRDAYHYLVKDKNTFEQLSGSSKYLIEEDNFLSQIKKINNFIVSHDIEIVIFNGNRPIYFLPFIKVKKKIAYKHTSNNAFSGYKRFLGHVLLNFCYLFSDKIVILYEDARKEVLVNKGKVRVINNGVEGITLKKNDDFLPLINIICVSRLDPNKGIEWLVKVFFETFGNNNNVQLKVAGLGPLEESLKKYISTNNIGNIKLLGFVTDIESQLQKADIFILPSKFESFPLSILEAMSCGLPIIATDTGGVKDMVLNNKNGFLINYNNDKELNEALESLCNDKKTRISKGNYSLNLFNEKFTIAKCVEKIEKVVYEI